LADHPERAHTVNARPAEVVEPLRSCDQSQLDTPQGYRVIVSAAVNGCCTKLRGGPVPYSQACPRCGREFVNEDKESVADEVVEHARLDHRHALDREIVLAHIEGVHPYDRQD
jgi:hypothetical protein